MATFDELAKKIKTCKTKAELDDLRLPLVRFVPEGGDVQDFYKLQKMFRAQKVVSTHSGGRLSLQGSYSVNELSAIVEAAQQTLAPDAVPAGDTAQ